MALGKLLTILTVIVLYYNLCLDGAKPTAAVTEMGKHLSRVQSDSDVKTVGHLNGLTVHTLSKPNMPSTITDLGSQKTSASIRQKSESPVLLTKSGVRPSSGNSSESTSTVNGHPVDHLSQSSPTLKLKIPNSCEVSSASDKCNVSFSKKQADSSNRECHVKQKKHSDEELHRSKATPNSFVAKTPTQHKMHVQSSSGSAEGAEHSPSKWNCCVNLHRKDRVKTSNDSSQIHHTASADESSSHCRSMDVTERMRKRHKKLGKTKTVSDSSTTNWHVMKCSVSEVSRHLHDKVHGTTAWRVTDDASRSSVPLANSCDSASGAPQSHNASLVCNEAVRGGHQHMLNGNSALHEDTRNMLHSSTGQTVNCTYHSVSLMILHLKNSFVIVMNFQLYLLLTWRHG